MLLRVFERQRGHRTILPLPSAPTGGGVLGRRIRELPGLHGFLLHVLVLTMGQHDHWIAHRELTDAHGHTVLHVFLGAPRREESGTWVSVARFDWTTSGANERHDAHGADAFQALLNGLACIERALRTHKLSWVGARDSAGFPATISLAFGRGFHDQLVALVEAEETRELEKLKNAAYEAAVAKSAAGA